MKIVVNKLVGDLGEQWAIEVPVSNEVLKSKDPVAGITAALAPALRVVDNRLLEMNTRILARNVMASSLSPEALMVLNQTVQIMYGVQAGDRSVAARQEAERQARGEPNAPRDAVASLERALEATDEGGR